MLFDVALFANKNDNRPRPGKCSWEVLARGLTRHKERQTKDGPLWSPTLYHAGTFRGKSNVVAVSCLVLDFDRGERAEHFTAGWESLAYAMHTTFQHTAEQERWRAIFPLSIPVEGAEWPFAWSSLTAHFGGNAIDGSCKDASRIYYMPACRPDAPRAAVIHDGLLLDPSPFLRPKGDLLVQRAKGELGSGRNNAGMWLAVQMRDNQYTQTETEDLRWDTEVPREKIGPGGRVDLYTEVEWRETVRKAFGRPAREGWRPSRNGANGVHVDPRPPLNSLNSLDSSQSENANVPEVGWPRPLAAEAYYGIAGRIVEALAEETEADPSALLLNFLLLFGNMAGRSPHAMVGKTRHCANLFLNLVGRTGDARKGTSYDPIQDLFERAFPEYVSERIVGSQASGEGLISLVSDRREKKVQVKDKKSGRLTLEFDTVVEDEGVSDKRLMIVETEMSALLKVCGRSGNILSEQLRKAWETGDLRNSSKSAPQKATGAHISIIGHITPDDLKKYLTDTDVANGFGNRFLWLLCKRSKSLPEGGNLPLLNNDVKQIRELIQLANTRGHIGRDEEARKVWRAVYDDLTTPGVGMFGEMTARRAPIVLRLSLIYALLDGFAEILSDHVLAALAVWERCEESVRFLYGDQTGDAVADALHDAMLNRPEGASRTDLHAALGRNRTAAEIDRALTALQRSGRARMIRQTGEGGREAWHAAPASLQQTCCGYLAKARGIVNRESG